MARTGTLALVSAAAMSFLTFVTPPALATTSVPLKAIFEGTFTINPITLELHFSGEGQASHFGDSTIVGDSALVPASPGCFAIADDAVTLTAANGDQLFVVNSGQDCFDETGHIVGEATFTVTGGTGRFQDAIGDGVTEVVATPDTTGLAGTFVLTISGQISY
jgi:hypothetical protein